ncbi:MAG: Rieske 2Fe-2S domain-containing protein [Sphingomonadaceae bacterium]
MQQVEEKIVYSVTRQDWLDRLAQQLQQGINRLFFSSDTAHRVKDFLNGVWLAHPLHPAVTDIPIGAWTTALVLDGVESAAGKGVRGASSTAIGIGIGGAIMAAMSGIADWSDTGDEQRRIGLIHAASNSTALGLYTASLWKRLSGRPSGARLLSTAGWLAMFAGAYLGGQLAYRLGTQVDRNAWTSQKREFYPTMREADLPAERPTRAEVQGIPVMLVRHDNQIYALGDICSHRGCSLSRGHLMGDTIICACHGSTYRLEDGTSVHGPSPYPQPSYPTRVRDGQIEVCPAID